ncbi:hypothetical protein RUM43_007815 [Polyplax serrata]|uniref:Uncharacterized protein n=1 Tax=Polyplax serrata TaxID=468196 RepID=A0AAN8S836_POLSC
MEPLFEKSFKCPWLHFGHKFCAEALENAVGYFLSPLMPRRTEQTTEEHPGMSEPRQNLGIWGKVLGAGSVWIIAKTFHSAGNVKHEGQFVAVGNLETALDFKFQTDSKFKIRFSVLV